MDQRYINASVSEKWFLTSQLPDMIKTEMNGLEKLQEKENSIRFEDEWRQLEVLMNNLQILTNLAEKYRMGKQATIDETEAKFMAESNKAIELKIK